MIWGQPMAWQVSAFPLQSKRGEWATQTVFGAHPTASGCGCAGLRWNRGIFVLEKQASPLTTHMVEISCVSAMSFICKSCFLSVSKGKGDRDEEEKNQVTEKGRPSLPKQTLCLPRRKPTSRASSPARAISAPETTGTHWRL